MSQPSNIPFILAASMLFFCGCSHNAATSAVIEKPCCRVISSTAPASTESLYASTDLWETDTGESIRLSDLRGQPRIIALFFTSCEGSCSITLEHLREIEASLPAASREHIGFVLVTLDPDHDTVKKLAAYRSDRHLPPGRWTLLRGSLQATAMLATQLGTQFFRNSPRGILHTTEITVIDNSGKIVDRQTGTHPDLGQTISALSFK